MLVGKILHSPYPHARIRRIDAARALALEGVVAVVTGRDAPTTYGILPVGHDENALAPTKSAMWATTSPASSPSPSRLPKERWN